MRFPSLRHALLPLCASLVLAACHGKDDLSQPGGSSPVAAVQGSIDLLKADDFSGLWKHALPPADYVDLRTDWNQRTKDQPPISARDRERFHAAIATLTAPDAETTLYAQLQPKLTQMQQQYKDQLPVLISIGEAFAKSAVQQNKKLTVQQKTQLDDVLDVLVPWAKQTPWFDQAKAKQAIAVTVTSARKLDLKSPEQLHALNFDSAMKKYSTAYAGIKQLLAIYGLSVDDTLNSVKLTQLEDKHGRAVVKIDYTLLGKPLSTESTLVQQDGRWYSEAMLKNVREAHQQALHRASQPATSASASPPAKASTAAAKD